MIHPSRILLLCGFALTATLAFAQTPQQASVAKDFPTFRAFTLHLDSLAATGDSAKINTLWRRLTAENRVPFSIGDSVAMLYRSVPPHPATVRFAGDFNQWQPSWTAQRLGSSNATVSLWRYTTTFPSTARLDYKNVVGNDWILDPANPNQQWGGFGPNSALQMPDWKFPSETLKRPNVSGTAAGGTLAEMRRIASRALGYDVQYQVYLPAGYTAARAAFPVIYVADGQEYRDERLGAMPIVMDNLIADNRIAPTIAVFLDPRNPNNLSQNRRIDEYAANARYADFLANELVPQIDSIYNTRRSASARAIMGTSVGGINAAFVAMTKAETFGLAALHSPALWLRPAIEAMYRDSARKPLRLWMSTGTIFDTEVQARRLREIWQQKGYTHEYIEVAEGHSWGNWRSLMDDALRFLFGTTNTGTQSRNTAPAGAPALTATIAPNPIATEAIVRLTLQKPQEITLRFTNAGGHIVFERVMALASGEHEVRIDVSGFPAGVYAYILTSDCEQCSTQSSMVVIRR
ncbi:MAG: alpha/beta hydrolase-fold protein [Candidatus Kapaibacteriota bacterium]